MTSPASSALETAQHSADTSAGDSVTTEDAERVFSTSILVSAVRCTLTYVIFPFVFPFAGLADLGPIIGVVISVVAIVANVVSIKRMNATGHKWRVPVTIINVAMIALVVALLVLDLMSLSS